MPARTVIAVALAALFVVAGCGSKPRRTLVPKLPTNGDADARHRFQQARHAFERDGGAAAADEQAGEFEAIAEDYPNDPVAPYALLYAGIAANKAGEYQRAVASLEKLEQSSQADAGILTRGKLFRGIALVYLGEHGAALALLRAGEPAIENDDERIEWHAAMAESLARSPTPLAALDHYDRWYRKARASERAHIRDQLRALIDAAPSASLAEAYRSLDDKSAPSAAYLGLRYAAELAATDADAAARIQSETAAARRAVGMQPAREGGAANPRLVGAVLPLSGKRGPIGELAARGLTIAAGGVAGAGLGVEVALRDSGSDGGTAVGEVDALVREGAVAVVGPIAGASVAAVAQQARSRGMPVISLDPRPRATVPGTLFHIAQSAEDRARSLARHAYGKGARDFAILQPKSGYGRAVGDAFADEIRRLGGSVIVREEYEPNETSFSPIVRRLRKPWQAVFVPDTASRLALIAPALAAANMVSLPWEAKSPRRGRKILLLSTAEAADARYLKSAGRYSEGAVFAPGFYPDHLDPVIARFVDRYEAAYGRSPTTWEAHAFDAALMIREAAKRGGAQRGQVAAALAGVRIDGLTGKVRFGADGRRADDGLLFTVQRHAGGHVIRAVRD